MASLPARVILPTGGDKDKANLTLGYYDTAALSISTAPCVINHLERLSDEIVTPIDREHLHGSLSI